MNNRWLNVFSVCLVVGAAALLVYGNYDHDQSPRLLNVSYDPTRELYAELNPKFVASYRAITGRPLQIEQSHGGSSKQARAVSDGLAADVEDSFTGSNLLANGYNFMGDYSLRANDFIIMRNGTISGQFAFADSFYNEIWLNNACQLALMTLLTAAGSIPYSPTGYGQIEAALLDPWLAAVNF